MIDQAISIIRSRAGLSAEEAFERLTPLSQDENVKLHRVVERLVEEAVRGHAPVSSRERAPIWPPVLVGENPARSSIAGRCHG